MWEVSVVISKSEFSKSIWSAVSLDLPPACDQLIQGGRSTGGILKIFYSFFDKYLRRSFLQDFDDLGFYLKSGLNICAT